ncbi:MAG: SulP family inorganic anion transporter, partial [Pseudomonadota bacterium]
MADLKDDDPAAAKANLTNDVAASVVVALVALPLCLGIALASGAPLFSGLIAGIVGGLIVGSISASPLSVSGPAAGLTVIVLAAITQLPTYEAFLLAVVLSGVMQLAIWLSKTAWLSEFVPSSVITGMLAAIGLILILKQIPHAIGYDGDYEGSLNFFQPDGMNTLSALQMVVSEEILWGAVIISTLGLLFLFWWDRVQPKTGPLRLLPGPLVVVIASVFVNAAYKALAPSLAIAETHLVQVPVADSVFGITELFRYPDFTAIANPIVWTTAVTLALVATLESLLCINAVDRLDPKRRVTDKNREMLAQGAGNIASGMIGGLPLTSVIIRSSANVAAGADTKRSAIFHGAWLLAGVMLFPGLLNLIPLSALAGVLLFVGYKLTRPELYVERYKQGMTQFIPFVVTVLAILFTDLLVGILIGLVVGFVFV